MMSRGSGCPLPRLDLGVVGLELGGVFSGDQQRAGVDERWDLFAVEMTHHKIDAYSAHDLGILGNRAIDASVDDCLNHVWNCIEANQRHIVTSGGDKRLERAEDRRVVGTDDGDDIWVGGQDVLGNGEALVLVPV